jgi:hypothetical protein
MSVNEGNVVVCVLVRVWKGKVQEEMGKVDAEGRVRLPLFEVL